MPKRITARRPVSILAGASALAIILILTACSSSAPERSPGEMAFRSNCQTCHVLPKPSSRTDEEWPVLVNRYGTRAKLNAEKIALITEYLQKANDE